MKVACTCKSEFQDARYGKNVRIANPVNKTKKDGKPTEAKCTVCGTTHHKFVG